MFASKSIAAKAAKAIKTLGGSSKQRYNSQSTQPARKVKPAPVKKNPFAKNFPKAPRPPRDMYKKRQSGSAKSGLNFPVGRVLTKLRKSRISDRVSKVAGVYMTSVMVIILLLCKGIHDK
jgi:hypothetical protein